MNFSLEMNFPLAWSAVMTMRELLTMDVGTYASFNIEAQFKMVPRMPLVVSKSKSNVVMNRCWNFFKVR